MRRWVKSKKCFSFMVLDNKRIAASHNLISVSVVGEYDVSFCTTRITKVKKVFIHHNGVHIGTICGDSKNTKKSITISMSELCRQYQGKGIMSRVYESLVVDHNLTVFSDTDQTVGGTAIWLNLFTRGVVSVSGIVDKTRVSPDFKDLSKQTRFVSERIISV